MEGNSNELFDRFLSRSGPPTAAHHLTLASVHALQVLSRRYSQTRAPLNLDPELNEIISAERRNRTKFDGNIPKRARSCFYRKPAEDLPKLQ